MAVEARFAPKYQGAIIPTATTTSASSVIGKGSKTLCLTNLGTEACYVRVSFGPATATSADFVIPGNTQHYISKDQDADTISYVAGNATTSLHIMPGEGF